ncbi:hypothetical protein U1Q18_014342 [Sarracenia purpurea var. burkii]
MHRTPLVERSILLNSFPEYGLVHQFSQIGWIGACNHSQGAYSEVVREFYANIESAMLDFNSHTLRSIVRGIAIEFYALDIADLLGIPVVLVYRFAKTFFLFGLTFPFTGDACGVGGVEKVEGAGGDTILVGSAFSFLSLDILAKRLLVSSEWLSEYLGDVGTGLKTGGTGGG